MSDSMFLSNDEVFQLTGKRQRGTQAQMLRAMGIEHKIRPDGRVIVLRQHVEQLLGVKADRRSKPVFEPDWSTA
jgi:hypothetical protein